MLHLNVDQIIFALIIMCTAAETVIFFGMLGEMIKEAFSKKDDFIFHDFGPRGLLKEESSLHQFKGSSYTRDNERFSKKVALTSFPDAGAERTSALQEVFKDGKLLQDPASHADIKNNIKQKS